LTASLTYPTPDTVNHTISLTEPFAKQGKPIKTHRNRDGDGGRIFLLVKTTEKYWRMDYRLSSTYA